MAKGEHSTLIVMLTPFIVKVSGTLSQRFPKDPNVLIQLFPDIETLHYHHVDTKDPFLGIVTLRVQGPNNRVLGPQIPLILEYLGPKTPLFQSLDP